MSSFSDFSDSVTAALIAALPDAAIYPGSPPDTLPPASAAVGYVWVTEAKEDTDNALLETVICMVRFFPIQEERFDGSIPISPTPLYEAAATVQSMTLADSEASTPHPWFFHCVDVQFNHDDQFIEATLEGTAWNDAAIS